ncbi:carbonic anhydrase-related protein 10-like [Mercenaria mercenaria]|uniref:carbonic anhydrase-related protein 10-like n=1 Tax=Mercenaria mercenaria TaxID=6596 RepID=UPI00234EFD19|nr:carbonic anhydrase-related protein 10-like [Mercenaria mercenaria]XP_045204217.2 carbonic anhydrase-related protein 10-like [Mercenaria mercenaria]XP_045204218.2 carbonic anhydrase-related protein 10-like [Mercenaria mercenaria]
MMFKVKAYVTACFSSPSVIITLSLLKTVVSYCPDSDHWSGWWGYNGMMSGPLSWGDHNDWKICKTGKNQSPIDILPNSLLYDPQLQPLKIETASVNGVLRNDKRDLTFLIHNTLEPGVNITSGPLSYTYKLYQIKLHYGRLNTTGSEHRIDGKAFAGELQFLAFNSELYTNYTEAQMNPRGIAVLSVFLSIGDTGNSAFEMFRQKFVLITQKDSCTELHGLPIDKLLPRTDQYMTYSGSLTQPGCRETVTWVLLNKPIYISYRQMADLRETPYQEWIYSNARPVMPLNHRTVRTNINFRKRTRLCSMEITKKYEANPDVGQR